jgi:hypothetical protein
MFEKSAHSNTICTGALMMKYRPAATMHSENKIVRIIKSTLDRKMVVKFTQVFLTIKSYFMR